MRAGRLDRRVSIERRVTKNDDAGQAIDRYVPVAEVWAEVRPVNGSETFAAQQRFASVTHRFLIRWRADVNQTCRLVYEGAAFDVVEALEVGRRQCLDVLATSSPATTRDS